MHKLATCTAFLLATLAASGTPASRGTTSNEDLAALVEELLRVKDDAQPEQILELAKMRTPEALDGLIQVYDALGSIYMRRVAMQGMVVYDDVPKADQVALQKLMDVATDSEVRELRNSAVDCIAECSHLGKPFLRMIVEPSADDEVRESAMRYHTERPRPDDMEWYDEVFDPSALVKARKAAKKAKDEKDKVPHKLPGLRALAFGVLAEDLEDDVIVEALEDDARDIRLRALEEVDARGIKDGVNAALDIYEQPQEWAALRLAAVEVLARHGDEKIVQRLMKDALRKDSSREFANGVAEILSESDDPSLQRALVKGMTMGGDFEKIFRMRAGWGIDDPKVDKALSKLSKDKKPDVRREAVYAIGRRGNTELLEDLERVLARDKDPSVVAAAVEAVSALGGTEGWAVTLTELTQHEDEDVRNAAVEEIGRVGGEEAIPVLVRALDHEQWSTRLKAARALEALRVNEVVGTLIERMEHEDGRMQAEIGGILWRLTGQPLRNEAGRWASWWEKEQDGFQILTPDELVALEEEREMHRLKQVTRTSFFGIRVVSHRVIFIIDISGSMDEATRGRFVGETGERRMDVAKKELDQCLDSLNVESLFNIVTFADSAVAWQDRVSEWTNVSLAEAKEYVSRQEALGGTNLFGALYIAFEDPIVDTIYVLSDGDPTVGEQTDPGQIRETVREWNRRRGVEVHCIAVGGDLDTLAWLAEDSGGQYVRIP